MLWCEEKVTETEADWKKCFVWQLLWFFLALTGFGLRSSDVDDEALQLWAGLVQLLSPGSLRLPVVQQVLKAKYISGSQSIHVSKSLDSNVPKYCSFHSHKQCMKAFLEY